MKMINKLWRILATGLSFSIFGLGGIVLTITAVPILYLLPSSERQREQRAKRLIHYAFRAFMETMKFLGIMTYHIEDIEKLNRPGQLILANHPTLIDIVFLIGFIKQADCVVKSSLIRNPFTKGPVRAANYIANDSSEKVMQLAAQSLQRGNSLIIFPEGTRTTQGKDLNMQRGAANIALRCKHPIVPVILNCTPSTLTKELSWYQVPDKPFHISLKLNPEMSIEEFQKEPKTSLAARRLTRFLENYFTMELATYE
jgi:1-acyl-sn-glycerol-3-phosphate acyltransferase